MMPKISLSEASKGIEGRLNRAEAAEYLGVAPSTLADWHRRGIGPKSIKPYGRRFYRTASLRAFIEGETGPKS